MGYTVLFEQLSYICLTPGKFQVDFIEKREIIQMDQWKFYLNWTPQKKKLGGYRIFELLWNIDIFMQISELMMSSIASEVSTHFGPRICEKSHFSASRMLKLV